MLTYRNHFVILSLVAREKIKNPKEMRSCGSVGTGRRARLRILWALRSCGFKSHLPHWKFPMKCDMRKCRNWQTSKTKDLVSIALVWVQVPSSAWLWGRAVNCSSVFDYTKLFYIWFCARFIYNMRILDIFRSDWTIKPIFFEFFFEKRGICGFV